MISDNPADVNRALNKAQQRSASSARFSLFSSVQLLGGTNTYGSCTRHGRARQWQGNLTVKPLRNK